MILIIICMLSSNPFYESNFSSLPLRSVSIFSNPAGLGIQPGAELLFTYHPDTLMPALTLGNLGLGMKKVDSLKYFEIGTGYKLPGVFSIGYAHQCGDTSNHVFGIIARSSPRFSLGYKTSVGKRYHMVGGISLRPFEEYITLSGDIEYEGVDSILNFYYGAMIQPLEGVKLNFHAGHIDEEFNWNAGLELSFGKIKFAGAYSRSDKKFRVGLILSAQPYGTFVPESNKITRLHLKGSYPEIKTRCFLGIPVSTEQGFTRLLSNLESLRNRDDVKAVLVELGSHSIKAAQVEELRNSLIGLKDKGKKIIFFADDYHSTLAYELACSGDEIILSPTGSVIIAGLALRKSYLRETLEKLGLETDIVSIGEYKSAIEKVTRSSMSEADREQIEAFLDDIYFPMINNIAHSRSKTSEEIEALIEDIAYFNSDRAKIHGLIDTALYDFELEDYLTRTYDGMPIVDFQGVVNERAVDETWYSSRPKIALVIAEGTIVSGEGAPNFFQTRLIGSDRYVRIFEDLRKDKNIDAVIFRINSPGGYAVASEKITQAVQRCAAVKPVVVTMGGVAASGGYHVACPGNRIYANKRTLTGSIGVFDIKFVTKGLYDKLGISWDYVKRGKHSDFFWGLRHLTEDELEREEEEAKWWYDKFVRRVAQCRGMSEQKVDILGQGRIYSGASAQKINLIDQTGGYLDALADVKEMAGITGEVEIVFYPRNLGFSLTPLNNEESRFMYLLPEYEIR